MNVKHECNYQFCFDTDVENWERDYNRQTIDLLKVYFADDKLIITLYGLVEEISDIVYFSQLEVNINRKVKISQDKIDVVVLLMKQYKFESSLRGEYQRQLLERLA